MKQILIVIDSYPDEEKEIIARINSYLCYMPLPSENHGNLFWKILENKDLLIL